MELTCTRCHRTVGAEDCYCPTCGLPQLTYSAEDVSGPAQPERWNEVVRDAATVAWRPALRLAVMLAIPAGLLSSEVSRLGALSLFWMAAAAAWVVVLYVRNQQARWITIGAGARIGLVTGIIAAWLSFAANGAYMFARRYLFHQGGGIDKEWHDQVQVNQQFVDQFVSQWSPASRAQIQAQNGFLQTPWAQAGYLAAGCTMASVLLLFFAVAGGALGARLLARRQRPEI
jgi:hypothetical protein